MPVNIVYTRVGVQSDNLKNLNVGWIILVENVPVYIVYTCVGAQRVN